ncbi:hypothetical protein QUB80_24115 [Chlorogloeopsis sp. ULAP01]|uniref:hypothetical protein n=1 Tax=Chlorogloeopsis sp. ULAP01 TaxID=3056483 RepID=UPI0025AAA249|nr:hypothetical protein [Chlorogloeopsis sp. ULAP01]MDM9383774.1 hypothetical protein [Chlorogloeopsis sp. ULAP01]
MKIKILGFALLLGLASALGACDNAQDGTTTTTPAPGEPTDAAATKAPAATPTKSP